MAARKSTATKIKLCRALMSVTGITLRLTKFKLCLGILFYFSRMPRQITERYGKNKAFEQISTIYQQFVNLIEADTSCNEKVDTSISLPAVNMSIVSIRPVIP